MSEMGKSLITFGHLMTEEAEQIATYVSSRRNLINNGVNANQAFTVNPRISVPAKGVRFSFGKYVAETPTVKQEQYCEVKKMSPEVLASLWGARYGFAWISMKELNKDDLYCAIAVQLLKDNYIERQTRKDNTTVFRLLDF
jgi:hypothetical protein